MTHKTIVTGKKGTGTAVTTREMVEVLFSHPKDLREHAAQPGPKSLLIHTVESEFDKPDRPKLLRVKVLPPMVH